MLSIQNLQAWHGAAQALFGISLTVAPGELVVLQGLNGAGKSTLMQAVMGLGGRTEGDITFNGHALRGLPAHQRARLGLGYVAEGRRLFTALSVQENLAVAATDAVSGAQGLAALTPAQRQAQILRWFPALQAMLARPAAHMSGGEQQMLAIARTLMTAPTLLLLDEPCEGIAPVLVEAIRDTLLGLRAQGLALLVAEQNAILAQRADRVITLVAGQIRD